MDEVAASQRLARRLATVDGAEARTLQLGPPYKSPAQYEGEAR